MLVLEINLSWLSALSWLWPWIPPMLIVAIAAMRLLLMRRGVRQSYADEEIYLNMAQIVADNGPRTFRTMGAEFRSNPAVQSKPPPQRIVYLLFAAILLVISDSKKLDPATRLRRKFRVLSWISTGSAVLTVLLAGSIGWRLGGPSGGLAAALLVGTCPLLLGLGRRALLDVPSALCQIAVVGGAVLLGPEWWPLVAALTAIMLLNRESTRSSLPGLLVAASWAWGWQWWLAAQALGVGLVGYAVGLRLATGLWPWQFPGCLQLWLRRDQKGDYALRWCQGGFHRLIVDLVLLSPVVVLTCLVGARDHGLALAALWTLLGYTAPWLDQQIRSVMLVDILLRLAAALVAPWWALAIMIGVDLYIYWRCWLRSWQPDGTQLYDPTTSQLMRLLGMGG